MIVIEAEHLSDGLYNIKNGKIFKYKANGGTVRTYKIHEAEPCYDAISIEVAIQTTWMILNGMGYPKEQNKELEQTIKDVFATAPRVLPNHSGEATEMVEPQVDAIALDKATLMDYLINSVDENDEPVWTESHIDEILKDFDIVPKTENCSEIPNTSKESE